MTRSELYKEVLPKLVDYLWSSDVISEDEKDSVYDFLNLTQYQEAASQLMSIPTAAIYKKIAKAIYEGLADSSEIMFVLPVRHQEAADKDRLMVFCYKTTTLALLPVITIIKESNDQNNADLDNQCKKVLDLILLAYKDNVAELHYLWDCFKGQHEYDYFLLSNEPDSQVSNWRQYSYAYFCYVNEHRFERPSVLNYNKENPFSASIRYNSTNKYEQYFDAYNVMSESKYADDVLSRFLRMYQLLEYLAYRRALADLTKGNIKENGFVRNVISKASKGSVNEFEELKKGLKDVLPDLSSIITPTEITVDMQTFIRDRLMIKNTNHDNAKFWVVVYQLRNSIVHNKESELHFMYANTKVYEPGIALMKLLIEKIEPAIVSIINDPAKNDLEFTEQRVQVY